MPDKFKQRIVQVWEGEEGLELMGRGCGCCATSEPVTMETLDSAIADAEGFLAALQGMRLGLMAKEAVPA